MQKTWSYYRYFSMNFTQRLVRGHKESQKKGGVGVDKDKETETDDLGCNKFRVQNLYLLFFTNSRKPFVAREIIPIPLFFCVHFNTIFVQVDTRPVSIRFTRRPVCVGWQLVTVQPVEFTVTPALKPYPQATVRVKK